MHVFNNYGNNSHIALSDDLNETADIQYIAESLNDLFEPKNVETFSIALATECKAYYDDECLALLVNTSQVINEFESKNRRQNLRVFPIAFSPRVCSFQSQTLPFTYAQAAQHIIDSVLLQNSSMSTDDISFRSFQAYSTLRQHIKPDPQGFQLEHSLYTGVHGVFPAHVSSQKRKIYLNLQEQIKDHQPFKQFEQGIHTAINTDQILTRFEPVFTLNLSKIQSENCNSLFLAKEIILGLINVWEHHGATLIPHFLVGFKYQVFIDI